MTSLLGLKERVDKTQERMNSNLSALSGEIQGVIDGLVGTNGLGPDTYGKGKKSKQEKRKGVKSGKKVKNDMPLKQGIVRTMGRIGIAESTRVIAERMLADGWKTKSKAFGGVVGQCLATSDLFKRNGEGNWQLA